MLQIVVDTNVFFGLLRASQGAGAGNWLRNRFIQRLLLDDGVQLLLTVQIYAEYINRISVEQGCDPQAVHLFFGFLGRLEEEGKLMQVSPRYRFCGAADSAGLQHAIDKIVLQTQPSDLERIDQQDVIALQDFADRLPKDNKFIDCLLHDWQEGEELLTGQRFLITNDGDFDPIRNFRGNPEAFISDARSRRRPVAYGDGNILFFEWRNLNFSVMTPDEFTNAA